MDRGGAGRPVVLVVTPDRERVYVLARRHRGRPLVAARVGLGGVVLDRRQIRLPRGDYDVTTLLRSDLEAGRAVARRRAAGLGARRHRRRGARDGPARGRAGPVRAQPRLGGRAARAAARRPAGHPLPVDVGNDARPRRLGRAPARRGRATSRTSIYLSGEVGLGGGIIVGGRPLIGAGGATPARSGTWSSTPSGRPCHCGGRGCWETEVGEDGDPGGLPGSLPARPCRRSSTPPPAGDEAALAGLRRTAAGSGSASANLVNLFNPEVVVFGGRLQRPAAVRRAGDAQASLHTGLRPVRARAAPLARPGRRLHAARGGRAGVRAVLDDPIGNLTTLRAGA